MPLYALQPQRGDEDYAALYAASRYKDKLLGVYYDPVTGLYAPVFRMNRPRRRDAWAFRRVDSSLLERAYRMLCPACGLCCVRNSAAFAFPHEVPREAVASQPVKRVDTRHYGDLEIILLDTGPAGRCVLYDPATGLCRLQAAGLEKPITCMVHYCTLFAARGEKLYIRVATRRDGAPVYRAATPQEVEALSKRLASKARRLAARLR